jgi:glycine cleavage system aminomethyltransferase T
MRDTPDEAGLGAFVRPDKGPFSGRDALVALRTENAARPSRRLTTIVIGEGEGYLPVYGGEAVRADGTVIGRLRSVAYGPMVSRTIGYVYRDPSVAEGSALTVDVFNDRIPATVAPDALWDPSGARMRG